MSTASSFFFSFQGDLRSMWSEPFTTQPPPKYQTIWEERNQWDPLQEGFNESNVTGENIMVNVDTLIVLPDLNQHWNYYLILAQFLWLFQQHWSILLNNPSYSSCELILILHFPFQNQSVHDPSTSESFQKPSSSILSIPILFHPASHYHPFPHILYKTSSCEFL